MSDAEVKQLISRIEHLSDSEIIKALASPSAYTVEATVIYESEGKRRGIRLEAVRPVGMRETQRRKDKIAATWSIKGIGERLYGMRFFQADGSYQTTKWFIFLHLPIYPLCSLRVRPHGKAGISVAEVLPIDWRQVLDTYCFVAFGWAGIAMAIRMLERYSLPFSEVISAALIGLPFLFLYLVRLRGRRKTHLHRPANKAPL